MPEVVKSRSYNSPRRTEQAAATRQAIVDAARELFTTRGYPDTTVADVARLAGVSVDTLYASVGRKPQLLLAAFDLVLSGTTQPLPVEDRDFVKAIRAAPDARAKLASYAASLQEMLPALVPLAEALRVAGLGDDECRQLWQGLDARRADNMLRLAAELRSTGEVRDDLTDEDVAHLLWTTNSSEFYRLATAGGRTPDRYAHMVLDIWTRTLLT